MLTQVPSCSPVQTYTKIWPSSLNPFLCCLVFIVAKLSIFKKNYKRAFGIHMLLQKRIEAHKISTVLHQFKMDGKMGSGEGDFSMNHKHLC